MTYREESIYLDEFLNKLNKKNKIVYIAGKITGTQQAECEIKFLSAQKTIERFGFEVYNPMLFNISWHTPQDVALQMCLPHLYKADIIFMLHDWRNSKGAFKELNHFRTKKNGCPIFFEAENGYNKLLEYSHII